MDWEFFWIILIVIGLDGYLYWHFSHIFNLQYDLTNKLLTKFHTQEPQAEVNTDLGFDITGNEIMQVTDREE